MVNGLLTVKKVKENILLKMFSSPFTFKFSTVCRLQTHCIWESLYFEFAFRLVVVVLYRLYVLQLSKFLGHG